MSDEGAKKNRPFHVGLTQEVVVDGALELTRRWSLWQWSMRDLARHLGVSPGVLYHHVGGKDLLARKVAERVIATVEPADPGLSWQDWFRQTLWSMREPLEEHPGVAKWLLLHGPTFAAATTVVDAGVATLQRAGFGQRSAQVYAIFFNTAIGTIASADDRLEHDTDGPRDHATIVRDVSALTASSPGLKLMQDSLMTPFAENAGDQRREYFDVLVETLIAGVETTVSQV